MARQSSILKFEGNIGDLNFVKTRKGYTVRKRPTIPLSRIMTDPKFRRTRENMSEFGFIGQATSVFKKALSPAFQDVKDGGMHNRLLGVFASIKNLDVSHDRGSRTVTAGIADVAGQAKLNGFDFNVSAPLADILLKPYSLNTDDGILTITDLIPDSNLLKPLAAHKAGFNLFWAKVDFAHGEFTMANATEVLVPLDTAEHDVTLTIPTPPTGAGVNVFALKLVYYQTVNGTNYQMNDSQYVCSKIIAVL